MVQISKYNFKVILYSFKKILLMTFLNLGIIMNSFKILYLNTNDKENLFQAHTQITWDPHFTSTFSEIRKYSLKGENLKLHGMLNFLNIKIKV